MTPDTPQRHSRPKPRRSRSYRFGEETVRQLDRLSVEMNASKTWVLERLIREEAERRGVR